MSPDEQPTILTSPPNGSRHASTGWQAPSVEEMQAMLPQYEVIDILGRGGMGAVYKARQKSLKRLVAIKILPLGMADDEMKFVERFQNEAQTMAAMNHPAIVSVYDFGETANGLLYFIMEYVDGSDVHKLIQASGKLSGEYALAITSHVCDALDYAHKRGVIHRDIKPANILIDQEGHIKVADFGLAKMDDPSQTSGLTKTNMAMGTPDYVAPEVLSPGMVADHRADLYAVGVMLYQMLTGEVPRGMFKLPSQKGLGIDVRFDEIICKAMEQDREERYQSAMDVRHALDVILTTPQPKDDGTGIVSASQIPQKPVAKQPRPSGEKSEPPEQKPAPQRGAEKKPADKSVRAPVGKSSATSTWLSIAGIVAVLGVAGFLVLGGKPKPQASATTDKASATAPSAKPQPPIKVSENPKPTAAATSTSAKGKEIDLLALVDVKRDAVVGEWSRKGDSISVGTPPGITVLELPYQPPEEYDFEMEFTPDGPGSNVNQYVSAGGHSFAWKMNAHSKTPPLYGFELLDGKFCKDTDEASTTSDMALVKGQRYHSTVQVRRGSLRALLDGKLLVNWVGDFKRLSMETIAKLRDDGHIGIGSWKRAVTFHKIIVREVAGTGTVDAYTASVAVPAKQLDPVTTINWLNTAIWEKPWVLERGALKSTVKDGMTPLGTISDGTIRVRLRDVGTPVTSNAPPLQLTVRYTQFATDKRGHYLLQIYPQTNTCNLIYLERNLTTGKEATETLWNNRPLPADSGGGKEFEFEFRAEGDTLSVSAAGQEVASIRDVRLSKGTSNILANPTIEITRLETVGVTNSKLNAAPIANPPPPAITNWRDVTDESREKAKSIPGMIVETQGIRWDGTGYKMRQPLPQAGQRDQAISVRYTGQAQVDLRVSSGGFIYVLAQPKQTIFQGQPAGPPAPVILAPAQPHPADFDPERPHELLVTMVGARVRTWLDGRFVFEGNADAYPEGESGLMLMRKSIVHQIKVADLTAEPTAAPSIANWQDVTASVREKARAIPSLVVEADGVRLPDGGPNTPTPRMDLEAATGDRAVRVRYVGQAQVSLWARSGTASAFVLVQRGKTMFKRLLDKAATESLLPSVPHPAGFDADQPHELLITVQGPVVRVWLDGRFVGDAQDDIFTNSATALMFIPASTVQKVEVAALAGSPDSGSEAKWQPIFNQPSDFGGDMRDDVEFRDGATFIKARTFLAPADPAIVGIRSTMRYLEGDRTGSLTLRSTEAVKKYGEEDFGLTAYIAPNGTSLVVKMRDRPAGIPAGINQLSRHDYPLSPALKEGEPFTFELRAEGKKIIVSINGREISSLDDVWTGTTRRFGITPSVTEMTEFRDVAVMLANSPQAQAAQIFNGHRYLYVPGDFKWEEAKAEAEKRGGHLAVITSAEENDWAWKTFSTQLPQQPKENRWKRGWWLGASHTVAEKPWSWLTGESLSYESWGVKEPSTSINPPRYLWMADANKDEGTSNWSAQNAWIRGGCLVEWDTTGG